MVPVEGWATSSPLTDSTRRGPSGRSGTPLPPGPLRLAVSSHHPGHSAGGGGDEQTGREVQQLGGPPVACTDAVFLCRCHLPTLLPPGHLLCAAVWELLAPGV